MRKVILITGAGGFIGSKIRGGRPFRGDITNYGAIIRQTRGVSGIVHLAAVSNHKDCDEDPVACFKINLLALAAVLEVALMRKVWVLFISTFQVLEPHLYGLTKLTGEELCRLYQEKGLKVKILRLPVVYGPGDKPHKLVTKIIADIKSGKIPKIETNRKFHFAYVDDVARLIEKEIDIMSFRPGRKYSLHELTDGIKKCLQGGRNK